MRLSGRGRTNIRGRGRADKWDRGRADIWGKGMADISCRDRTIYGIEIIYAEEVGRIFGRVERMYGLEI